MKLFEMLQDTVFPPDVKFVSQDADGLINMYHSDPGERYTKRYWTCVSFMGYLQTPLHQNLYLPLADDHLEALLVVSNGTVVGLADGCRVYPSANVTKAPMNFTINLCQEDFDYMMDGMEIAELTVGIVNQILKEHGVDIVFSVEDSSDED